MASEENKGGGGEPIIATVGGGKTTSADFMGGEGEKPKVKQGSTEGTSMEFGNDGSVTHTAKAADELAEADTGEAGHEDDTEAGDDTAATETEEGAEEEAAETEDGDTEAPETLPDWDPDNEEVAAKWDATFYPDGENLDTSAFNAELEANMAKEGGKAELNEASYKYLKDRLGVSKEAVDQIIAGHLATREKNDAEFYALTGGKDAYEGALEWAKGVYTPDQKKRFNDAIKAGGEEAREQVELLMTRAAKGGFKAPGVKRDGTTEDGGKPNRLGPPGKRRPSSPQRTTTKAGTGAASGGPKPFADNGEYVDALKAAAGDKAKQAEVRNRLKASTFWRKK